MIRERCFMGPFRWRRFTLAAGRYFHGPLLLIFFGSLAVLILAIIIGSELLRHLATGGALFAMISWLSLTGFGIVWKSTLHVLSVRSKARRVDVDIWGVLWFLTVLSTGAVFLGIGLWLAWSYLKRLW